MKETKSQIYLQKHKITNNLQLSQLNRVGNPKQHNCFVQYVRYRCVTITLSSVNRSYDRHFIIKEHFMKETTKRLPETEPVR